MIQLHTYDTLFTSLASRYGIHCMCYVPDLVSWADERSIPLTDPYQPMRLIMENGTEPSMYIQSEVSEKTLHGIIDGLSVRWALKDTATNMYRPLDTDEKKAGYYFIKEYARTIESLHADELLEDQWAIDEMKKIGIL